MKEDGVTFFEPIDWENNLEKLFEYREQRLLDIFEKSEKT